MSQSYNQVDLSSYIEHRVKDEERLKRLDAQLQGLNNSYEIEKSAISMLNLEKVTLSYDQISPEFLRLNNQKECDLKYVSILGNKTRKINLSVPKFSVYTLNESEMEIKIEESFGYYFRIRKPEELPENIKRNLAMSTELFADCQMEEIYQGFKRPENSRLSKETKRKIGKGTDITLRSSFVGLIPGKTKEKIEDAKKMFGNKLYIVAETKPDDWHVEAIQSRYMKDPLLLGVLQEKLFLVDKFDTTPIEDFVSTEYKK